MDSRVGRVLQDRYKILARIAEGAMGTVYRAEQVPLGRAVAVKFLHRRLAANPVLVKRFEVEARAMSRLNHPSCVSVADFGVDGLPYIVMDFVPGASLQALLQRGPLPVGQALSITRQVLSALAHAHAEGIVHRDIKPENIMIEQAPGFELQAQVLDFGIAKILGSDLKLTGGMSLGTPNYMAPEQTCEGTIDQRVDLYSMGVVLFEMLTGRPPFDSPEVAQVFLRIMTMPPPRLRVVAPDCGFSVELEQVLLKCLAKDREARFASAAAMAAALDQVPEAREAGAPVVAAAGPTASVDGDRTIFDPIPAFLREDADAPQSSPAPAPGSPPVRGPKVRARAAAMLRGLALRRTARTAISAWAAAALGWVRASRTSTIGALAAAAALTSLVAWVVMAGGDRPRSGSAAEMAAETNPPPAPGRQGTTPAIDAPGPPGEREQMIHRLLELRRSEPGNAEHPAALARLYFDKRWWAAGLAAYRSAVKLDPKYRGDPALLDDLISALQSDKVGDDVAAHLRGLGPVARPQLKQAAKQHPSQRVRQRAAEILKPSRRGSFKGWFGRR